MSLFEIVVVVLAYLLGGTITVAVGERTTGDPDPDAAPILFFGWPIVVVVAAVYWPLSKVHKVITGDYR